jgi:hypothetical protein
MTESLLRFGPNDHFHTHCRCERRRSGCVGAARLQLGKSGRVPIFGRHSFTVDELIYFVCAFLEVRCGLLSVKEQNQVRYSGEVRRAEGISDRWADLSDFSVTSSSNCTEGMDSRPGSLHSPKLPYMTEMRWIGGDLLSSSGYVFSGTISSICKDLML